MSIAYVNTCTSVCEERAREVDCVKGSFARVLFREKRERERERERENRSCDVVVQSKPRSEGVIYIQ